MKTGRSLTELAQEIERQAQAKRDFVASTEVINLFPAIPESGTDGYRVALGRRQHEPIVGETGLELFGATETFHFQLAGYAGIPKAYYDRMKAESPDLLTKNVNHWLHVKPAPRMVRTLDGNARAFLSDRYRCLDNYDVANAALPKLLERNLEILSCEITEKRLYIKAVDKRLLKDIPTGRRMGDGSHVFFDTVSPAIIISNSEIGMGTLLVETGIWTHLCTNLAIAKQRSMRKYHLGAKAEISEEVYALLSDRTKTLSDAAVWSQVKDVVAAAFDRTRFETLATQIGETAGHKITGDVQAVLEVTAKKFSLREGEQAGILRHLIEGGDLTQYGLHAAVTRQAEDVPDYDRATELERLGGEIIELGAGEWRELAEAA